MADSPKGVEGRLWNISLRGRSRIVDVRIGLVAEGVPLAGVLLPERTDCGVLDGDKDRSRSVVVAVLACAAWA